MRSLFYLMFALVVVGCGGKKQNTDPALYQEGVEIAKERVRAHEAARQITQADFLRSMEQQGVSSFSFDSLGYLIYSVEEAEITADPDWVARQYFDMAENVEGIKGCKLVTKNGKVFGRYE